MCLYCCWVNLLQILDFGDFIAFLYGWPYFTIAHTGARSKFEGVNFHGWLPIRDHENPEYITT